MLKSKYTHSLIIFFFFNLYRKAHFITHAYENSNLKNYLKQQICISYFNEYCKLKLKYINLYWLRALLYVFLDDYFETT